MDRDRARLSAWSGNGAEGVGGETTRPASGKLHGKARQEHTMLIWYRAGEMGKANCAMHQLSKLAVGPFGLQRALIVERLWEQ